MGNAFLLEMREYFVYEDNYLQRENKIGDFYT